MTTRQSCGAFLIVCLALITAGCGSQGSGKGKGRTASRGHFNFGSDKPVAAKQPAPKNAPKNSRNQQVAYEMEGELSPEASVKRDLERLRQREKEQAKNLKEMREALAQGSEIIRKEEDRLVEIRQQIEQFESAQRLYQQAAAERGPRGDAGKAPVMTADLDAGGHQEQYRAAPATYTAESHGPAPQMNQAQNTQPRRDYPDARQLSYDNSQRQAHAYPEMQPAPQAQNQAPARQSFEEETLWNPPARLFSQAPATPAPQGPAQAMRPHQAQAPRPAQGSFPPPAQPRATAQPVPERPAGMNTSANTVDDDVFMPDLFLSGGK